MMLTSVILTSLLYAVSIAESIPTFRSKRDNAKCRNAITDYDLFEYGFDVTEIDLFACPRITGNRSKIYDLNHCGVNGQKWKNKHNNIDYDVPDVFGIIATSSSVLDATLYKDFDQYRQPLMNHIDAGDEFRKSLFVSSDSYKKMHQLYLQKSQVVVSTKFHNYYALSVDEYTAQKSLRPDFQRSAQALPDKFVGNEEHYIDFIKKFGTHYLTQGTFGGLTRRVTVFGPEYSENGTIPLTTKANMNFPRLTEGDIEVCSDSVENKVAVFRNYDINYSQIFIGGQISDILEKGVELWLIRYNLNPGLISLNLQPISSLLTTPKEIELRSAIIGYTERARLDFEVNAFKLLTDAAHIRNNQIESIISEYDKIVEKKIYDKNQIKGLLKRIEDESKRLHLKEISASIKQETDSGINLTFNYFHTITMLLSILLTHCII